MRCPTSCRSEQASKAGRQKLRRLQCASKLILVSCGKNEHSNYENVPFLQFVTYVRGGVYYLLVT